MKTILYSFVLIAATIFIACTKDDLPKANLSLFQLDKMTATAGDMAVRLSWTPSDKGTPVDYYLSWTAGSKEGVGGEMNVAADQTSAVIENLVNNVAYTFSLQPRYKQGLAGKIKAVATPKSERFPVTELVAAAGDKKIRLTWVKPESAKLTGYSVLVTPGDKTLSITDNTAQMYIVDELTNGTEYSFAITAIYSNGKSDPVSVTGTPGAVLPITVASQSIVKNQSCKFEYNDMYFTKAPISSASWAFGDATTSNEESPSHSYVATGRYTVTVTVTYTDNTTESGSFEMVVEDYKWTSVATGAVKSSNPVISNDGTTVYVTTAETAARLHAIDLYTGVIKWTYTFAATSYGGGAAVGADGTIYQGTQDGKIYAVKANGTLKWQYSTPTRAQAYPAITSDGKFYAVVNGTSNATLHCVNADSGTKLWSEELDGTVGSAVAVDAIGNVYAGTNTSVYSFTSAGAQRWKTATALNVTESGSFAIDGATLYAALKADGGIAAINMNDGTIKWNVSAGSSADSYFPIVGTDGGVYFTSKGSKAITALNPSDGSTKWSTNTGGALIYAALALSDEGKLYAGTQAKVAGVYLLCTVEASTGTLTTAAEADQVMSGFIIAPDKRAYYGTVGGNLKAFEVNANIEQRSWGVRGGNMQGTNSLK